MTGKAKDSAAFRFILEILVEGLRGLDNGLRLVGCPPPDRLKEYLFAMAVDFENLLI
jgi:hypothetical protein